MGISGPDNGTGFILSSPDKIQSRCERIYLERAWRPLTTIDLDAALKDSFESRQDVTEISYKINLEDRQSSCYLFDDHNHLTYALFRSIIEGKISKSGCRIINFDKHSDAIKRDRNITKDENENAKFWTSMRRFKSLKINDFFSEGINTGVYTEEDITWISANNPENSIGELSSKGKWKFSVSGVGSSHLKNIIKKLSSGEISRDKFILSIDLDYFADFLDEFQRLKLINTRLQHDDSRIDESISADIDLIAELMTYAGLTVFCTSPTYIPKVEAIGFLQKILKKYKELCQVKK